MSFPKHTHLFLLFTMLAYFNLPVFAKTSSNEKAALKSLELLLTNYASEQLAQVELMLDPAMIGHQQLTDAMHASTSKQKQIRLTLLDTQFVNGANIVVIRTGWEKRFVNSLAMTPVVTKGQSIFLMQLFKKEWKLAALSGDNPFAP